MRSGSERVGSTIVELTGGSGAGVESWAKAGSPWVRRAAKVRRASDLAMGNCGQNGLGYHHSDLSGRSQDMQVTRAARILARDESRLLLPENN
jgi:hypothetical protein